MNYVKRHVCQIVKTPITRTCTYDYFELLSQSNSTRNNKLSIALPRFRTKAAQNGFYYQVTMIYNSLTRDNRMQENENLLLKRLRNFNI